MGVRKHHVQRFSLVVFRHILADSWAGWIVLICNAFTVWGCHNAMQGWSVDHNDWGTSSRALEIANIRFQSKNNILGRLFQLGLVSLYYYLPM